MAVIKDLVLTFCPTMHSVQQKKLKLLMPLFRNKNRPNGPFTGFEETYSVSEMNGIAFRSFYS